ncbi:DUF2442 domain-containing protein [bacterium]|nr:DUF2442 domain-containing protein [bacterium]
MSTLVKSSPKSKSKFRRAFVPTKALAKVVKFDDEMMHVYLTDGRIISVPIIWFPLLHEATPAQRKRYEIGGDDVSLHWPEIDKDLSAVSLIADMDWQSA